MKESIRTLISVSLSSCYRSPRLRAEARQGTVKKIINITTPKHEGKEPEKKGIQSPLTIRFGFFLLLPSVASESNRKGSDGNRNKIQEGKEQGIESIQTPFKIRFELVSPSLPDHPSLLRVRGKGNMGTGK